MRFYFIILLVIFFSSCEEEYFPKQKGYFRIDLPEKDYLELKEGYPYFFKYSKHSLVFDYKLDSFWVNIFYPKYKATIYLTYKELDNNLKQFSEQTRTFVYKHAVKADAIGETPWANKERKVYGILYDIKGNTASSLNFYLTDSVKNYISGALYFNNKPNKDSLAPVVDYIREDIIHLIETFEWK